MDHKQSLDFRTGGYKELENQLKIKYDYKKNGILPKILPRILFKGNPILVAFLQLIDIQLISMFSVVEKLQNFKDISSYKV